MRRTTCRGHAADGRQHLVVVVVADVDGEIAVDALDGTRPVERPRAAGAHRVLDGLLREVLDEMARAASGEAGLVVVAALPQPRHVPQPEMRGLDVHGHVRDAVLHVRVVAFVRGDDRIHRVVVRRFRRAEE